MQTVMESIFDALYLLGVITAGVWLICNARGRAQYLLLGIMAVVLGAGDAFHLVPRVIALGTTGLAHHSAALGTGKLITSITMTVFYVLLYHIWRVRYRVVGKRGITAVLYTLAAARVILCLLPQNEWLSADAPVSWGIYRNIPFALMGIVIIVLYYRAAKAHHDRAFRFMWLAISLSFAFYIPVVLWADAAPLVGMLMIPKTFAYMWVVAMGFMDSRRQEPQTFLDKQERLA